MSALSSLLFLWGLVLRIVTWQLHATSKMGLWSSASVFPMASDQSISGLQTLIRGDEGGFDPKLHKYLFQKISIFSSEEKGGKSLSNQETHKGWLLSHPPPHWSLQKPDLPKRKRKTARLAGSVGRFSRVTSLPQLETSVHSNPKSVPIPLPCLGREDCPALSFCTLSANNKQSVCVGVGVEVL